MKIPSAQPEKEQFVQYIVDCCMTSQEERRALYQKRRNYFLYGQDSEVKVRCNKLKSHLKLVSSFLFSPDGMIYNIAPPKNAEEYAINQLLALQDDWNEDVRDSGLADVFADAVLWSLIFDSMIVKLGWNDITGQIFGSLIEPVSFGVFRPDDPQFDNQQAMSHSYLLDYDDACARLVRAGRRDQIDVLGMATGAQDDLGFPAPFMNLMVTEITGGQLSAQTIMGNANPNYQVSPSFKARTQAPLVRFYETWIWDDEAVDFRIFTSLEGGILLSDSLETIDALRKAGKFTDKQKFDSPTNFYLPRKTPFTPVVPFGLYNYFWGDCHSEDIIPLQDWSVKRLREIDEILEAQVDPLRTAHGMTGIIDEKAGLDYGGFVADEMPGSKLEEHRPPMPEDAFREFNEITALMMEASGLTEVVSGKSSGGARGGQQQKQMQITGGGQIRRVAVGLEGPLLRMGDTGIRLKMKNDDTKIKMPDGSEFVAAQVPDDFTMQVDGHSHSPLFTMESRELAQTLFKAQAIDREWLIRMLNPTQKQNLLHSLRLREKSEAQARQQQMALDAAKHHKK